MNSIYEFTSPIDLLMMIPCTGVYKSGHWVPDDILAKQKIQKRLSYGHINLLRSMYVIELWHNENGELKYGETHYDQQVAKADGGQSHHCPMDIIKQNHEFSRFEEIVDKQLIHVSDKLHAVVNRADIDGGSAIRQ